MQPSLRLLPVAPNRLYAYWTVAVAGHLRLATPLGETLLEVEVGIDEEGRFFDLPAPIGSVIASLSSAALAGGSLTSSVLELPASRSQGTMVVWGRADGSTPPTAPARAAGALPYLPARSSAGSHLPTASSRAGTTASATSPGNSWRRP